MPPNAAPTPTVFLSSRFAELRPLRHAVRDRLRAHPVSPVHVIDLDENTPEHEPPLALSLSGVRRADLFVLLLGRSYGTIPPGQARSYVHLEYLEALRAPRQPPVLAWLLDGAEPPEPEMEALRRTVLDAHRAAVVPVAPETDLDALAERIASAVLAQWWGLTVVDREEDPALSVLTEGLDPEAAARDSDRRLASDPRLDLTHDECAGWNTGQLLRHPARVAALEHRRDAQAALDRGEWRLALWNLREAQARRPRDLASLYWSARIRLYTGRRDDLRRAVRLADRAVWLAERERVPGGDDIAAAAALIVAARAEGGLGHAEAAVEYAARAREAAPGYWRTYLESARQHALAGEAEAVREGLRRAFYLRPGTVLAAHADPDFGGVRPAVARLVRELETECRTAVEQMLEAELETEQAVRVHLSRPDGDPGADGGDGAAETALEHELRDLSRRPLLAVVDAGRASFDRHLARLRALAARLMKTAAMLPESEALRDAAAGELTRAQADLAGRIQALELPGVVPEEMDWTSAGVGGGIALLLLVLGASAIGDGGVAGGVMLCFLGLVAVGITLPISLARGRRREIERRAAALRAEMDTARLTHDGQVERIERWRTEREAWLRDGVRLLVERVEEFERTALARRIFCTTAARHRPAAGDLLRLRRDEMGEDLSVRDRLLPDRLLPWSEPAEDGPLMPRLYRVVQAGRPAVVSRADAYF